MVKDWDAPLSKTVVHPRKFKTTEVRNSRLPESANDKVKGNIFRSLSNFRPDYLLGPVPAEEKRIGIMADEQRIRKRVLSTPR
jgi:hypothetical protein